MSEEELFEYNPDTAFPPGATLMDVLEERGLAVSEVARLSGLSEQQLLRLFTGSDEVTEEAAAGLAQALDIPAKFWLRLEAQYREWLAEDQRRLRSA
jgi:HTH-type transcriptional regulator/antitoxin HigA